MTADLPRAECPECGVRQLVVDGVLFPHGRLLDDHSDVEHCPGSEEPVPQPAGA